MLRATLSSLRSLPLKAGTSHAYTKQSQFYFFVAACPTHKTQTQAFLKRDYSSSSAMAYVVLQVPIFNDNYSHVLVDLATGEAAAVDPAEPQKVLLALKAHPQYRLTALFVTHKHADHAGGNVELAGKIPNLRVYGSKHEECPAATDRVGQGDEFRFGSLTVKVLHTPCHTKGHIQFFVEPPPKIDQAPSLFCGDTLFVGGCGRFFEGTAKEMHENLIGKLSRLPLQTKVYCGHEYTLSNLAFAKTVEPKNPELLQKIEWAAEQRKNGLSTVPTTIGDELKFNPFMRVGQRSVKDAVGQEDEVEVMAELRRRKDSFRG
eukprot:comp15101_c0_seq1/m.11752 comp15101_c0_seq1/g.11752  ORF comp15101_c0_seq1/g.11752 comp15101_c0_seq1/m.11752 type:complete len:318 (-) comp15101_c0_seq1:78-1031(-)